MAVERADFDDAFNTEAADEKLQHPSLGRSEGHVFEVLLQELPSNRRKFCIFREKISATYINSGEMGRDFGIGR
jgi:hypothetical protein